MGTQHCSLQGCHCTGGHPGVPQVWFRTAALQLTLAQHVATPWPVPSPTGSPEHSCGSNQAKQNKKVTLCPLDWGSEALWGSLSPKPGSG